MNIDESWEKRGDEFKDCNSFLKGIEQYKEVLIGELNNYINNHPQYKGTRGLPKEFSGIVKAISIINNLKYND